MNMVKNASVQATDIYKDPYGYTYSEMVGVLGEVEADKFYRELYSGSQSSNKYKTITIKEIFRGPDTQKYAFELSDGYCIETVSIKRKTAICFFRALSRKASGLGVPFALSLCSGSIQATSEEPSTKCRSCA